MKNFDGDYDTTYVKNIDDCTDEELQLIVDEYNDGHYVDDDILDAACDALGYTHIHKVDGYRSHIDVFSNQNAPEPWGWSNRDHWEGCTWEDFTKFVRDRLLVLKRDEDKLLVNSYIDEWLTDDENGEENEY